MKPEFDVIIVGAGLSGLSLAYYLRSHELKIKILEGRTQLGGRIKTIYKDGATLEMGATWLHSNHTELLKLLQELGLEIFQQELGTTAFYEAYADGIHQLVTLPENQESSFRIKGGTFSLIETLQKKLENIEIEFNCNVNTIEEFGQELLVKTSKGNYRSNKVISTLPPYLFQNNIKIIPSLPEELRTTCMKTHTWMGESIKIGLFYERAFWKENGHNGTVFSNSGPITEMYDHSNAEGSKFALKGFLSGALIRYTKKERLEIILKQLEKYYGADVRAFTAYQELVWENETFTFSPYKSQLFPHQNNGNHVFRKYYLNDNLIISGTETAAEFPGYMEGAIRGSQWVSKTIKEMFALN